MPMRTPKTGTDNPGDGTLDTSLTTVGIWKSVRKRLSAYVAKQRPRVIVADVASIAVSKWLDENEDAEGKVLRFERPRKSSAP